MRPWLRLDLMTEVAEGWRGRGIRAARSGRRPRSLRRLVPSRCSAIRMSVGKNRNSVMSAISTPRGWGWGLVLEQSDNEHTVKYAGMTFGIRWSNG